MTADMIKTLAAMSDLKEAIKGAKLDQKFPSNWKFTAYYDTEDGLFVRLIFVEHLFEITANVKPPTDHSIESFRECVSDAYDEIVDKWDEDYHALEDRGYETSDDKFGVLLGIASDFPPYLNPRGFSLDEAIDWFHFIRDIKDTSVISEGDEYFINGVIFTVSPHP